MDATQLQRPAPPAALKSSVEFSAQTRHFSGPYSRFYQVLREELFAIGRWKRKPRGDPQKAIEQTRRNVES
jgi:hypothetical protein